MQISTGNAAVVPSTSASAAVAGAARVELEAMRRFRGTSSAAALAASSASVTLTLPEQPRRASRRAPPSHLARPLPAATLLRWQSCPATAGSLARGPRHPCPHRCRSSFCLCPRPWPPCPVGGPPTARPRAGRQRLRVRHARRLEGVQPEDFLKKRLALSHEPAAVCTVPACRQSNLGQFGTYEAGGNVKFARTACASGAAVMMLAAGLAVPTAASASDAVYKVAGRVISVDGELQKGFPVSLMVEESLTPAEIEAGENAAALFLGGAVTGDDGSFSFSVPATEVPDDFFNGQGIVESRVIGYDANYLLHSVVQFVGAEIIEPVTGNDTVRRVSAVVGSSVDASSLDATVVAALNASTVSLDDALAKGAFLEPENLVNLQASPGDFVAIQRPEAFDPEGTVYDASPSVVMAGVSNPSAYCYSYESPVWENINTARRPHTDVGRVQTKGGTEATVGAYNGNTHRTEVFVVSGGTTAKSGLATSRDTSVDWAIRLGRWQNVSVRAEVEYRYRQLACINHYDQRKRYPGVGEWYPLRATAGTSLGTFSGDAFACNVSYRTGHVGTQQINVSRGKTRTVSNGVTIGSTIGGVSLGISTSTNVSDTNISRLSWHGKLAESQRYFLCGSNDIAIYAVRVREV